MAMMANKKEWEKIGSQLAKMHGGRLKAHALNKKPYELVFVIVVDGVEKNVIHEIDDEFRSKHRFIF